MTEPVYTSETPADETPEETQDDTQDSADPSQNSTDPEVSDEPAPENDGIDWRERYLADEDELTRLRAQVAELLAAAQANQTAPDAVVSQPVPGTGGGEAVFVPVEPPEVLTPAQPAEVLTPAQPVPAPDAHGVEFDPAPELSDSDHPTVDESDVIDTEDELFEKVSEILVLVREIHETVAYVKAEAPKIGEALSASPFGKMLPGLLSSF